jgi:hemoglobin/transferrin/lactoferrin receptor protein
MRNGLFRFSEWYYGPQQWLFGSYQLRLLATNRLYNEAKIIAAIQHITESRHTRNFNNPKRSNNIEQVQIVSLNADFNKLIGEQELRYGVEVIQNYVSSKAFDENIYTGARSFRTTRYPDGSRFFSGSVYGSHRWELNKKWVLNDGIRFNYSYLGALLDTPNYQLPNIKVHQKNMSLTGQIGLVWRPAEKYWNSLHIATGYRVPNVDDMGKVFEANAGQLIVPNPDLKPERNYSIELNLSYRLYNQVWFSINSYYCLFNNALALQPFRFLESDSVSINGDWFRTFANVNAERATIYGFTTSLGGEINNYWSCNASITYTKGTLKLNSDNNAVGPLDHIPPLFGNINIIYRYKRLTLEGWIRFAGWKRIQDMRLNTEDNERYATADGYPAWQTIHFRTSFQLLKDLQLQMALENILDVHYRIFASGISAPGRNLIVALRKQF